MTSCPCSLILVCVCITCGCSSQKFEHVIVVDCKWTPYVIDERECVCDG